MPKPGRELYVEQSGRATYIVWYKANSGCNVLGINKSQLACPAFLFNSATSQGIESFASRHNNMELVARQNTTQELMSSVSICICSHRDVASQRPGAYL